MSSLGVVMNANKPKVAIALGSGGAKGLAHIGVLKVLQELNFKPDIIVGSSMGAIIGSCYALGFTAEEIEKKALELTTGKVIDIKLPNSYGFIKGDKAEKVIRNFLQDKADCNKMFKFSDCKIPFGCVSADLSTAEVVDITKGDLIKSVRASFSINGVFMPVKIGKRNLTDGGILCRVPVNLARKMGADIVIAIDCIGKTVYENVNDNKYVDTIVRIFTIMDYEISKHEIKKADYLISMSQPDVSMIKINNVQNIIDYGYNLAKEKLPEIINRIKNTRK